MPVGNIILIILAGATFLVAFLTFLASITSWFKQTISIEFGFLVDDAIVQQIELATGDPAKPICLRFRNSGKGTLTGVVFDIRFHRPLALSSTGEALSFIPGKTTHGRTPDNSYYLIRYSELEMVGDADMDFRVELNTQNMTPGTYKVGVTIYSTQQNSKYSKSELSILMK
jgi:hypothetical protein